MMGHGRIIDLKVKDYEVEVRDYGRGIPLGKVIDCVSRINTGGKFDSEAFQKSVGLNGVGTKAVNALSSYFKVESYREGNIKSAEFEYGEIKNDNKILKSDKKDGTYVMFKPDDSIFKNYHFIPEYLEDKLWNNAILNSGLTIKYNNKKIHSKKGLLDLLERKTDIDSVRYPIIHVKGNDIEFAMTHTNQYGEEYFSFVNGQYTTQ